MLLESEAESVCLLDLPLDAGNITKVVDVRFVLWRYAWTLIDAVSIQNFIKNFRHIIIVFVEQKNSFIIEKKKIYMFSVDFYNIPE
jgi:hypothetical protein